MSDSVPLPGDGIAQAKQTLIARIAQYRHVGHSNKDDSERGQKLQAVLDAIDALIAACLQSARSEPIPHESPRSAQEQCANIEVHLRNLLSAAELEEAGATITEGRPLHIRVMRVIGWLADRVEESARSEGAQEIETLKAKLREAENMARHNYRCAIREQLGAGNDEYPPLVDDEFAELVKRAESLTQQLTEAQQRERDLHAALRKVRAHTAHTVDTPELLDGLLKSIERIADDAFTAYQAQQKG